MESPTLSRAHRIRRLGNLLNLSSPLGLAIARLGGARFSSGPYGLSLAEGFRLRFPPAGAFAVGNVIITRHTIGAVSRHHPDVLRHESAHAWQYFWCGGLPFLPLYALAAGWSWLRTGDPASRNLFERTAGLVRGGYHEAPVTNAGVRRLAGGLQTLIEKPSRLAERSR
ncbi:MAG: hypothetical protein IPL41_16510 [Micropruina sp.]|nr:hypothetical protein [Micropruina sp.]